MHTQDILTPYRIKVAVSVVPFLVLLVVIVWLLCKWHDDIAILCALLGTSIGWLIGTMLSPFGGEARQFESFGKVISAFVTGFLVSKVDTIFSLLSKDEYHNLITNGIVIREILIGVTSGIIAMMFVFISRQYYFYPPEVRLARKDSQQA
jgi:hypothetical protein